ETIRTGLIPLQAVVVRQGIPTTSSKPTYALQKGFSELFSINLYGDDLDAAIENWQKRYLSKAAITRLKLMKDYGSEDSESVQIKFPDGAIRKLEPGPSSLISKAVIEEFAPRFLKKPKVLWLSESGNKVVAQDEALAKALGLQIDPSRTLPDIILVDLGDDSSGLEILVVFTEVVASDGPINRQRKEILTTLATEAGFDPEHLAFLTAFLDRSSQPFKKSISELAWGSYAWFSTEPDYIIDLREHDESVKLTSLSNRNK
ncbi:BsuBI/PstI family type II restriction endonuclease, partial [Thiolapillus sp.]